MFATIYFFTLLGLVMQIIGDITYTIVDPRIDFEGGHSPLKCVMEKEENYSPISPTLSKERLFGLSVSKLTKRRWEQFKANGRAYWSLWIFLILFLLTLPAELIANDKPLLVNYDGAFSFSCF